MDDNFFSILNEFLSEKSLLRITNFKIRSIFKRLNPFILNSLKDAEKEKNYTRIQKLYLIQAVLKKNMYNKNTLLHIVAKNDTVESAKQLLKCGANVNAENREGKAPIFYAIKNSKEMFQLLLNHSKVNWDLLRQVLLHGTEETLGLLLEKSLFEVENNRVSSTTNNYKFHGFQDTEISIHIFLQNELRLLNIEESYPLLIFFIARIYRKDILSILLDDYISNLPSIQEKMMMRNNTRGYEPQNPVELNIQGLYGETALHYAAAHQLIEVVRFLLEQGADPNCQDRLEFTPLHFASLFQNEEMCQLLLSYNANVNPNSTNQINPLNLVCGEFTTRCYLHLKYYYNDEIEHFTKSQKYVKLTFNPRIMKLFLNNGANPDASGEEEVPILLKACQYNRMEEVKILLEYGANIRAVDSDENSALHYAAFGSSPELVDFLLEKGLDIDARNHDNCTPLMTTVELGKNRYLKMVEYLVDRGANVNAVNNNGETPLHIAISYDTVNVELLLELGADWTILNVDETRLNDYDHSLDKKQQVLISFIALREKELSTRIKFYIGDDTVENFRAIVHFQKSKLEVMKLKMLTISKKSKIPYYDFLTKDFYSSVQMTKNLYLRKFFKTKKYKKVFPFYESLLKHRFTLARNLKTSVDETYNFILNYTKLPIEIVDIIISNLRSIDFRVFGRVLSNKRF